MSAHDIVPTSFPDTFGDAIEVYDFGDGTAQLELTMVSSFDNTAVVYTHEQLTSLRDHLTEILDKHQERTQ